jgi:hypothetical protein
MRSKSGNTSAPTEKVIKDLDLDIDKKNETEDAKTDDFTNDEPAVDMWSDETDEMEADKKVDQQDDGLVEPRIEADQDNDESEDDFKDVEKPSFLRRLKKRKENKENSDDQPQ